MGETGVALATLVGIDLRILIIRDIKGLIIVAGHCHTYIYSCDVGEIRTSNQCRVLCGRLYLALCNSPCRHWHRDSYQGL